MSVILNTTRCCSRVKVSAPLTLPPAALSPLLQPVSRLTRITKKVRQLLIRLVSVTNITDASAQILRWKTQTHTQTHTNVPIKLLVWFFLV